MDQPKYKVPLPLTPQAMSEMPEPIYHKVGDTKYSLYSVYFNISMDYSDIIKRASNINKGSETPGTTPPTPTATVTPMPPKPVMVNTAVQSATDMSTSKMLKEILQTLDRSLNQDPEKTKKDLTYLLATYAREYKRSQEKDDNATGGRQIITPRRWTSSTTMSSTSSPKTPAKRSRSPTPEPYVPQHVSPLRNKEYERTQPKYVPTPQSESKRPCFDTRSESTSPATKRSPDSTTSYVDRRPNHVHTSTGRLHPSLRARLGPKVPQQHRGQPQQRQHRGQQEYRHACHEYLWRQEQM